MDEGQKCIMQRLRLSFSIGRSHGSSRNKMIFHAESKLSATLVNRMVEEDNYWILVGNRHLALLLSLLGG